jgi:hypothetical protein
MGVIQTVSVTAIEPRLRGWRSGRRGCIADALPKPRGTKAGRAPWAAGGSQYVIGMVEVLVRVTGLKKKPSRTH